MSSALIGASLVVMSFCSPVLVPPPAFDHPPRDGFGVISVPIDELWSDCGLDEWTVQSWSIKTRGREGRLGACTLAGGPDSQVSYWIYVRDDLPRDEYQCVMRHEEGHVNGWVHASATPYDSTSTGNGD